MLIVDCKGQVGNSYVLTWIIALPLARAVTGVADRAGHSVADPWWHHMRRGEFEKAWEIVIEDIGAELQHL
jgi:hypothetical protein